MNKFKGLDLVDRVPEELWTEVGDIAQEAVIKTIPKLGKEYVRAVYCHPAYLTSMQSTSCIMLG